MALGYDKKKIIETFHTISKYTFDKDTKMWITDFNPENFKRPIKISHDLVDAKNKKVVLNKGEKIKLRNSKKIKREKFR